MDNAVWGMLNDSEQALLREAAPKALADLDEDALATLHDRVRRARNKYSKLYRRRAAAEVSDAGARSKGHARHARTLIKAEAFEEALADVSRALARAARASATALRQERLAAAKAVKGGGAKKGAAGAKAPKDAVKEGRKSAKKRTPASEKRSASTKAATKRRQAARDSR
ncbi:MAG TPA: hypothetical protein PKE56_11655 [Acidimicrobiales bacterium]|jgi:hypothetical protein|nr:hypothetical protein [Acidimicrobiales bacterium]